MGAEYNTWSARITPQHNVTLALTRILAGPMDYTPGGFDNVTKENFTSLHSDALTVMSTRTHQTQASKQRHLSNQHTRLMQWECGRTTTTIRGSAKPPGSRPVGG